MHATDERKDSEVRFWHRGKTLPMVDDLLPLMNTPTMRLFDGGEPSGEYASQITAITHALGALQRSQLPMTADLAEARHQQFLFSLLSTTSDVHERVDVLKQLGAFIFRRTESPADRQRQLRVAVADPADSDLRQQARVLMAIWRPHPRSFLDALLQRPAEAGRFLARHLSNSEASLAIYSHNFETLASEERELFVRSGVIAYLHNDEIHLLGDVGEFLRPIDGGQSGHQLSALQLLLMHELTETLLLDTTELDAMAAHIVASTFERCLGGQALAMAVESFFIEWESHHAGRADHCAEEEDPIEAWQDCMVYHDELRPEAFVERSMSEQRQILREMFGDDWTEDDDKELVTVSVAAA